MYELRPEYQQPAHDITIEHCRESSQPAYHSHSVGAGKTVLIGFFTKHVVDKGGKVLVLARQGELISQNADDYRAIGGQCSIYSASLGYKSTYFPAIFGTEGTVYRALTTDFKDRRFDVLLVDECHEVDGLSVINAQTHNDPINAKDDKGKPLFSQYAVIIASLLKTNPKMRIVGYTGSPFRGSESILGDFWNRQLSDVGTYYLVGMNYLVPPTFGFGDDDHHYDLDEWSVSKNGNNGDFSSKELAAMQRKITKDMTKTQIIMEEVIERTKDRNGVLITCAGKKHCEQVAECLPDGSWGIVTDSTSTKERIRILNGAKDGSIKYVIQVNCLGQGVNVTRWDCCVILRKIGSLRYLIQLIGRVLRTLKPEQIDAGIVKHDGLVLDYTDTMEQAGDIYDHPITDMASQTKAKINRQVVPCPKCGTENSEYAVRCIGGDTSTDDGRCDHFFRFTMCLKCNTENAPTAQSCRKCNSVLIDPNQNLTKKAYTDADYKPVLAWQITPTKNGDGLRIQYQLDSTYHKDGLEHQEVATEYLKVSNQAPYERAKWHKFIQDHIPGANFRRMFCGSRTIAEMIKKKAMLNMPVEITHRVNDKGFSIINRKRFRSGREEKATG